MINKLHAISVKAFIIVFTWYWLSRAGDSLFRAYRFNWPETNWPALQYSLYAAILVGIGIFYFNERRLNFERVRWQPLLENVAVSYTWLMRLLSFVLFLGCLATVFLSYFFSYCAMGHSLRVAASASDSLGAYELAERIYRNDTDRRSGESLAIWQTRLVRESDDVRSRRNEAVARTYGPRSDELVRRYLYVASNHQFSPLSDDKSEGFNDETYSWYEIALRLAQNRNDAGSCMDALNQMAWIRFEQHKSTELRDVLCQVRLLIQQSPSLLPTHFGTVGQLNALARERGCVELPYDCRPGALSSGASPKTPESAVVTVKAIIVFVVLTIAVRIGFLTSLFRQLVILVIRKHAEALLNRAVSLESTIQILNRQISFDMALGDFDEAERRSYLLLSLVGLPTQVIAGGGIDRRRFFWLDETIVLDTVLGALLLLPLAGSFM
jgi:hypothetical protein